MKSVLFITLVLCTGITLAIDSSQISIRLITGNIFHSDHNECANDIGPRAVYVGLEICNNSSTVKGLQVTLNGFTGTGFSLAGGQAATQSVNNPFPAGSCDTLYWFCTYPCEDSITRILFTVSDSLALGTISYTTPEIYSKRELSAMAGGLVNATTLVIEDTVTKVTCFRVTYGLSKLVATNEVFFQPAANLNFRADCFQLINAEVTASEATAPGCIPLGNCPLYYSISSTCGHSPEWNVEVEYCFRINCNNGSTMIIPYASGTSGNDLKYTIADGIFTLPVELSEFSVESKEQAAKLSWATTTEYNSAFFEIQKSSDGVNFYTISIQAAAGFSSESTHYTYTDNDPYETGYYRLKSTDRDGAFTYSDIRLCRMRNMPEYKVVISPNPVSNQLTLNTYTKHFSDQDKLVVEVYDMYGRQHAGFDINDAITNVDTRKMAPGSYFLKCNYNGTMQVQQFIVCK